MLLKKKMNSAPFSAIKSWLNLRTPSRRSIHDFMICFPWPNHPNCMSWIYAHLTADPFMISWSVFHDPITQINDSYRLNELFPTGNELSDRYSIDDRLISTYDEFILMIQEHESWFHNWSSRCPFIPRSMILWWDKKEWWQWVWKTINSFHWSSISIQLFI